MREGPGTSYPPVGSLVRNDIVEVLATNPDGSWYRIRRLSDGLTGWSASAYLEKISTPPPPPPPPPPTGDKYRVTVRSLYVRSGPGTNFPVVGSLVQNEIVESLGSNPDGTWLQIRRPSDGLTGWSSAAYLEKVTTPPPPPPPAEEKFRVTATRLHIRQGPGTQFPSLGYVEQFRDRAVRKGSRYGYAVAAIDRSGREGDRSPWHAVGVPEEPQPATAAQSRSGTTGASASGALRKGKENRTGRENAREKAQEKTQEKAQPKKVRTTFLLDAAFHEAMSIDRLKDASLQELSYLGPGIDNNLCVVLPRAREVHAISRSGEIVATLGPAVLDAAAKGFTPHKLAVGADGRLVISDARNGTVACFGRNGDLLWSRRVDPRSRRGHLRGGRAQRRSGAGRRGGWACCDWRKSSRYCCQSI